MHGLITQCNATGVTPFSVSGISVHGVYFGRQQIKPNSGLIIYARGGNNHPIHDHSMDLNRDDFYKTWLYYLVKHHNFIVLGCDFRGSKGSTEGVMDDIAGEDINDIINLYHYAVKEYGTKLNKAHVYLYGESMGVFKSLVAATMVTYFKGLILCSGVYDLVKMKQFRPYLYGHWQKDYNLTHQDIKDRNDKLNTKRNISKITKNTDKIIIFHGNEDIKASLADMTTFTNRLIDCKFYNFDCHILHKGNHALSGFAYQIYQNICAFLLNNAKESTK